MALVALGGQPVSRLGLAGQQRMEPGCVALAWDLGINYFFSYGLGKGPFVAEVKTHLARHRDGSLFATGSESREISEVEAALERAQQALDIDTVDVFWVEYMAPEDSGWQIDALLEHLYEWKAAGRIRYVGVSTHNRPIALQLVEQARCDVLMHRYNMAHRGAEAAVLPAAAAAGLPVIAFTSTRWGTLLAGHPQSAVTPTAADCYRFALSQEAVHLVLTSPKTQAQLRANAAALTAPPLSQEELQQWRAYGNLIYGDGRDAFETSWP